jgi:predicted O-methyltransferase YrrM
MSSRTIQVTEAIDDYIHAVSLREPEVLRRLRAETAPIRFAGMQISPEQGQFMALLVRLIGARRYLEVGTFTGYSALAVALALPAGGQVVACDINKEWTAIGRRYWQEAGVAGKIDLRLAPAVDTLDALIRERAAPFDFAFIDADKENYDAYYERALKLVRPGGIIAIDNVLWDGKVVDPKRDDRDTLAIDALNRKIHRDERVDFSLLPIGDGLTVAMRR